MIKDTLIYWCKQILKGALLIIAVIIIAWISLNGGGSHGRYTDYGDYQNF